MKTCKDCKEVLSDRNRCGYCRLHYIRAYDRKRWKNPKKWKEQRVRIYAWIAKNPKRWKEIVTKAVYKFQHKKV